MIGATGSRHIVRRRASSPCVTPLTGEVRGRRNSLAPPREVDEDTRSQNGDSADRKPEPGRGESSAVAQTSLTVDGAPARPDEAEVDSQQPTTSGQAGPSSSTPPRDDDGSPPGSESSEAPEEQRAPTVLRRVTPPARLSGPDLPPGMTMSRRRAVNTLDHKTCALLHSKLKGLRLEDVA